MTTPARQPEPPDPAVSDPVTADPGLPDSAAPDPVALRRRVLLTGLVSLALFLVLAYAVAAAGLPDWALLVGVALAYALVVRPMMRPVREATKLRRRLAYQAFREGREGRDDQDRQP